MAHLSQEEQLKLITDLEIEMMADMYNRYTQSLYCVLHNYGEQVKPAVRGSYYLDVDVEEMPAQASGLFASFTDIYY